MHLRASDSRDTAPKFTSTSLLALRLLAAICFLFFTILLTYTCLTDGHPFRSSLLTPWMVTTLWDYYLTQLPFLLLCCYRERRSPAWAALTSLYFVCLGSSAVWSYVLLVLLRMRPTDPISTLLN